MHFQFLKKQIKTIRFWLLLIGAIFVIWFYFCLPNPLFNDPYSTIILDKHGELLSARISEDEQWRFPESDSIPIKFQTSIRMFEDEYFFKHPGINPVSLFRAIWQNVTQNKVVSGGSTLSMQVIRMACKHSSRSLLIKLYEMILALRLELKYSKQEIMNLYASNAPFGGNVVGIEAASWRYYNRPAYKLSWGESAALAVLPNSPGLVHPGKNAQILLKKRNVLLDKLFQKNTIDSLTCELAKDEHIPAKPYALPNYAAHLINRAIADGFKNSIIHSTVDKTLQKYIAEIAQRNAVKYNSNYISNIAILVLDTKSGEVISYIGNVSIPSVDNSSYVDLISSLRSSGSILKPFMFAAMLSEGTLLPDMLVADIPTVISGYKPENFDKKYTGAIPASIALAHSLNIPAVRMLQGFGVQKLHSILPKIGITTITQSADHYGLSLILGGAEVTLWDVTSTYANLGRILLTYIENDSQYNYSDIHAALYTKADSLLEKRLQPNSIIDAGAIWSTFQALSMLTRPWAETGWESFASATKIAWKTGTSFGHRDAWSVGVTPEYTVGVWVGNATGEGRPGLTGVNYASPVMFEVFKYLSPKAWFEQPYNNMISIPICRESGFRAGEFCISDSIYVPVNCVRADVCPYHTKVFLDKTKKYRVSTNCYATYNMIDSVYFVLPPAMEWYYRIYNPNYKVLPEFMDGCSQKNEQQIEVINPQAKSRLILPKSGSSTIAKYIFEAVHRNGNVELFWHVDNEFIGKTKGYHKMEYTPTIGKHILLLVDEKGNSLEVSFEVE